MTSAAELGATSAAAGGAVPAGAADGAPVTDAARSLSPFEMLFAGLHHEAAAKGKGIPRGGMARPMPGAFGAEARKPALDGAGEEQAEAAQDAAEGPAIPSDAVALDAGPQEQSLIQTVVLRIAAALDGTATKAPGEAAPEAHADAGAKRRASPVGASLALAVATARTPDAGADRTNAAPDLSVTRREKHFGPVLTADGAASAAGQEEDGRPATVPSASGIAFERMTAPRGRAEQIMMAGRAAPGDARAPQGSLAGLSAEAAMRTATAEARLGGAGQGGADAVESSLLQVGGASAGVGDGRLAGPAPTVAAPAGQPAAPTVFTSTIGPVKVLHIQLQPDELGALEIRMRLNDGGLEVHIEATRHETATLLKNDREALAHVLRGTGHAVDTVTVSFADKSGAQGQGVPGQGTQDGGQPSFTGARPDAHSGGSRNQGGGEQRLPSRPGSTFVDKVRDDQDRPALAARHGDLYL
jgi:chemotaxis protein MotD